MNLKEQSHLLQCRVERFYSLCICIDETLLTEVIEQIVTEI